MKAYDISEINDIPSGLYVEVSDISARIPRLWILKNGFIGWYDAYGYLILHPPTKGMVHNQLFGPITVRTPGITKIQ